MVTLRALWYPRAGQAEIRTSALPRAAADQVLVRALASGISRGTESLVFHARVPASQHALMRAPNMEGSFDFPLKYGYAWVGETVGDTGARIDDGQASQRVFSLQPHQSHCVLSRDELVPLPADLPSGRATLAANMETALNAMWDAQLERGATVSIVGCGVVGSLLAYLLRTQLDAQLEVIDPDPRRADFVRSLGARFVSPEAACDERSTLFHCSGQPEGLRQCLRLAAFEAKVWELSWYGEREVHLPLGEHFHSRRLQLLSSQVGHVAPAMRASITHAQRLAQALELLRDARLDALLAPAVDFDDLPARMPALLAAPGGHQVVRYPSRAELE